MSKDDPGQLRAPVRPAAKGGRRQPRAVAIAAEKKAVLGRNALMNDPVARQSAALVVGAPETPGTAGAGQAMTALVPLGGIPAARRPLDAEGLIERWKEGRSPQTLRAYANDLQTFATWMKAPSVGAAINALLSMDQGEANELVRSYRSGLIDQGLAPATINRRLSALRSLVALGKEFGYVTFDLATKNVRAEAYRDTRGPEPDVMVLLLEYAKAQPPHRPRRRVMSRSSSCWATAAPCDAVRSSHSTLSTLTLGATA